MPVNFSLGGKRHTLRTNLYTFIFGAVLVILSITGNAPPMWAWIGLALIFWPFVVLLGIALATGIASLALGALWLVLIAIEPVARYIGYKRMERFRKHLARRRNDKEYIGG